MGKKKFTIAALDLKHEAFIVYKAALSVDLGNEIYLLRKAQIAYLKADEVPIEELSKYVDFIDVFSLKLVIKLSEYVRSNDHVIKLIDD